MALARIGASLLLVRIFLSSTFIRESMFHFLATNFHFLATNFTTQMLEYY